MKRLFRFPFVFFSFILKLHVVFNFPISVDMLGFMFSIYYLSTFIILILPGGRKYKRLYISRCVRQSVRKLSYSNNSVDVDHNDNHWTRHVGLCSIARCDCCKAHYGKGEQNETSAARFGDVSTLLLVCFLLYF